MFGGRKCCLGSGALHDRIWFLDGLMCDCASSHLRDTIRLLLTIEDLSICPLKRTQMVDPTLVFQITVCMYILPIIVVSACTIKEKTQKHISS